MKDNLLADLQKLLTQRRSKAFYSEKLGIPVDEVDSLLRELRATKAVTSSFTDKEIKDLTDRVTKIYGDLSDKKQYPIIPNVVEVFSGEFIKKVNKDKGTIESNIETTFEPKSDVELAELHKIDLTKYKISTYWSKLKSNGLFTSSVLASLKKPSEYSLKDFENFLSSYNPKVANYTWGFTPDATKETVDAELSIADFHLAKRTVDGETIQDRKETFISTVRNLTKRMTDTFNIKKLVFPISNDFFHTDNYQNQTTSGTPQDVLIEYDKEYELGFDILVNTIYYLQTLAQQVEIILVQGNHDKTKSFYLAHALEVYFKHNNKIKFQRHHSVTKSVVLGSTFIGYHHGNCKIMELPLLFATGENSNMFGISPYREIHTGDKHHYMALDVKGVRVQQMPSLSGTDRWHQDNNFVHSTRAGLALIYHPLKGKICEFEERV